MRNALLAWHHYIFILAFIAMTVPTAHNHVNKLAEIYEGATNRKLQIREGDFEYQDIALASYVFRTKSGKIVSLGISGMVFILDDDWYADLDEKPYKYTFVQATNLSHERHWSLELNQTAYFLFWP